MDWTVLTAVALVGTYAGYLIGVLIRGTFIERGGGGESPPEPIPEQPSGDLADFEQWELEVAGPANVRI